jgi:purine-binding chemotaxis protein CheW
MTETAPAAVIRSFLTIEVGSERFDVPASDVAEVIRPPAITRVPLGPPSLVGLANRRGAVMPVVSLRVLLGTEGGTSTSERVVVIDRGSPIGLLIDRVAALGAVVSGGQEGSISRVADPVAAPARPIDIDALLARDFGHAARRGASRSPTASILVPGSDGEETDLVSLVSFEVAGQDFALPLAHVQEILGLPTEIAAVPQADAAMLGVVTLRGQLLPLVSLRRLLGLANVSEKQTRFSGSNDAPFGGESIGPIPKRESTSSSDAPGRGRGAIGRDRVVVAWIGGATVGLVADGMKEILRISPDLIDPVPAVLTRGTAEIETHGICRLEGGRRLVSILSTERLFRDQALVDQIAPRAGESPDREMTDMQAEDAEQFIVFQLGGDEFGMPVTAVNEVVRMPDALTRLPKAPAFVEGVMNLRGRVVPVIDQRRRFRLDRQGERRRERVVVVTIDHMQAGFVVDGVSEVIRIPLSQLRPTPALAADLNQVVDRIANIEVEGRMILLLDPRELLDRAEKDLLAATVGNSAERPEP